MAKLLPKKLFVRWHEGLDEPFLQADTCADMLLTIEDVGEEVSAGVYELKKKVKLANKTELIG